MATFYDDMHQDYIFTYGIKRLWTSSSLNFGEQKSLSG